MKQGRLSILAFAILLSGCSDKVGDTTITGDSYNFYVIEEDKMNDFMDLVYKWAAGHNFSKVQNSQYPLELEKKYTKNSHSSIFLESEEPPYYKLRKFIDFSGKHQKVLKINELYSEDTGALFDMVERFYIPPHRISNQAGDDNSE